ncbi:Uncharacterised protein [uncultured archaeon]|nr:Uncharacterised protein [uncultured archaeon]
MARSLKLVPVLVVGVPLLLLLAFFAFGLLGTLPMAGGALEYSATAKADGLSSGVMPARGGLNWYYNPFENPMSAMLFVLFCIAAPLITVMRLGEEEWKTIGAAALGTFFLAGAAIVTIGAFQNLLSMEPNARYGVDAGDLYGWVFLDIILAAIGGVLLYFAEKWRLERGGVRPIYSVVAHTVGLFIATYAAVLFLLSSAEAVDLLKRSMEGSSWANEIVLNPVLMFGWLFYSAMLFYISFRLLEYSRKGAGAMTEYALHTPVSFVGAISLCGAVAYTIIVLAGVVNALTRGSSEPGLSIFDLALAIVFNLGALHAARWLVARQMKFGIPRTAHLWLMGFGGITALVMLFIGVFSLYAVLEGAYNSDSWRMLFFALLSLAYGCGLICTAKKLTSQKYVERRAQEGSPLGYVYGEDEQAVKPVAGEISDLRSRVAKLEAKVARLEAAKRK